MDTGWTNYDQLQRAAIRRGLLAYMKAHKIGAPILARRIAEANDCKPEQIQVKTLYRFLAGDTTTNDLFVHMCAKLHAPDPLPPLTKALADFYEMHEEPMQGLFELQICGPTHSRFHTIALVRVLGHEITEIPIETSAQGISSGTVVADLDSALALLKRNSSNECVIYKRLSNDSFYVSERDCSRAALLKYGGQFEDIISSRALK